MFGSSRVLSVAALALALTCVLGAGCACADSLLVACYDTGKIEQFAMDGTYTKTFATRANTVGVIQGADGFVYAGGVNGVSKYAADGTLISANFITDATFVTDLAWHGDKLWLTDWSGLTAAYDPATGAQSGPSTSIAGNPYGIKFGPDGLAYVVTYMGGEVLAWDTATNAVGQIWASGGNLGALVWEGNDLYISLNNMPTVYRWTLGGSDAPVAWTTTDALSGLGITTYDGKLYRVAGNPGDLSIYSLADATVLYTGTCSDSKQAQQICVTVPEPSSLMALLAGAAGICGQLVRRRRS